MTHDGHRLLHRHATVGCLHDVKGCGKDDLDLKEHMEKQFVDYQKS